MFSDIEDAGTQGAEADIEEVRYQAVLGQSIDPVAESARGDQRRRDDPAMS